MHKWNLRDQKSFFAFLLYLFSGSKSFELGGDGETTQSETFVWQLCGKCLVQYF